MVLYSYSIGILYYLLINRVALLRALTYASSTIHELY